ncbi:MAG TPA: transglutaminase family protein [Humisphaera sp.]
MRHRVRHVTEYRYDDPVPLCHNVLHLRPRDTDRQTCLATEILVVPTPAARHDRQDVYGNHVTWLTLQEPHQRFRIEARSEVDVRPFDPPELFRWPAWEDVVGQVKARREPAYLDARQFTFDSPHVPRHAELAHFAGPTFAAGRSLWDATLELTERIFEGFKFDGSVTQVGTPVLDVLRNRHGVCQDFAHLMIGCLRSLGLPARYVSGYLLTRPPPGKPRLVGADASHAWVSVFFPDYGWVDFDPTNGCLPSHEHVTVGWARDYDDVAPVKGVILGGQGHTLSVAVDVEPVGAE